MSTEYENGVKNEYNGEWYPPEEFDVPESDESNKDEPAGDDGKKTGKSRAERKAEKRAETESEEPDPALIIPHRKLLKVVRYLARSNKAALTAGILTIVVGVMFGIAFMQEHMGQFTINLNRVDMWRRAISMSETADFANPTSRLVVNTIRRTTNIAGDDIPWDEVDAGDGDKSGKDYICYSFYIRNGGIEDVESLATDMKMEYKSKGAENAIRLAIIRDGVRTVYATPAKDGGAEPNTVPFKDDRYVMEEAVENFKVDDVHKYTIVMWIDGDDPECVDDIIGGSVRFSMSFDTGESRDVSLVDFVKNLPLFRGAAEEGGLGDKNDREGLWEEGALEQPLDEQTSAEEEQN